MQARPSRAKADGSVFVAERLAVKPNPTDEPAATVPFQSALRTVTAGPDCA
ncbi:hypothetical protein SHIRM173S_05883 [Streptomyces hirsutus]